MVTQVRLAIVGSGPGGLSAAVTAAEAGLPHLLLERSPHLADTVRKYQKGKKVMEHPMRLPLLGDLPFGEGSREVVLAAWQQRAERSGVKVRFNAEVQRITGQRGGFRIGLAGGEEVTADEIILAIGLQGNLRKLPVPGADRPWVQYQLDDPAAYSQERIVVVGAGDAAIENALALASHNEVSIINRQSEFSRAKAGNVAAMERAIRVGQVRCYPSSSPALVEDEALWIDTPEGPVAIPCDRIIARLGAEPPRRFLEGCGIRFPSADPAAVPELSPTYESNVPGLYIVGALAGYALIKQAINQGHEIVRRLAGDPIEPADEPLLRHRFEAAFPGRDVGFVLSYLRERVPVLAALTALQLREVMLESTVQRFAAGEVVFRKGDYSNSLWNIAEGSVRVAIDGLRPEDRPRIGPGEFFGELGLISGRRRGATIIVDDPCVLVEISRRSMRRLQSSVAAIKAELDRVAIRRMIRETLARETPLESIEDVIAAAELRSYRAYEAIINEGDSIDAVYILRSGSATISRVVDGRETVLGYVPSGTLFGERGLLDERGRRAANIRATVASEAIRIEAGVVRAAMARRPELRAVLERLVQRQIDKTLEQSIARAAETQGRRDQEAVTAFLVSQGVGEATNAFIIDESLCVHCNNCETACAATHQGVSRVRREEGASAVSIKLPIACRHCEHPYCMSDCPVDAVTRAPSGEVFINHDTCIGCGNCANNCPYGVIDMVDWPPPEAPSGSLLFRLLDSVGLAPRKAAVPDEGVRDQKAVKCDLCKDLGAPACVSACPTGAAIRIGPEAYMSWLRTGRTS